MSVKIHPTALIDTQARLAESVSVGAYSIIGADVEIGADTWIGPHVVVVGPTRIGRENRIFQFASLGEMPQDKKYGGEPTQLEIGDRNTIREFCTIHRGTLQDVGVTRIGNDNWIMTYVHVAHDCQIGNHTVLASSTQIAGHVHVDDWAILGGCTGVHQYVRIGAHSITAINTILLQDLPPFVTAAGSPARPHGINSEGLKRRGYTTKTIAALRRAYKTLYRNGLKLDEAVATIADQTQQQAELAPLADFLATISGRSIIR